MSTLAASAQADAPDRLRRAEPAPIPFSRLVGVEATKMFDTRSGFWLVAGMAATALLASVAVLLLAPDSSLAYNAFAQAVGVPMTVLLPVMAALAVTSEWSQRGALTTFTLVPHRGRVVAAKLLVSLGVGVASIVVAFAVGAVGNLLGAALTGIDPVWDVAWSQMATITLANTLGLLLGFTLGAVFRSSPVAIVGYFVVSLVWPPLSMLLAGYQGWWEALRPWLDFNAAQSALYDGGLGGEQWAQLGTASALWLLLPLAIGVRLLLRSEVK